MWREFVPTRRQMMWGILGGFVALCALTGIAYALTSVPEPNSIAVQQSSQIFYSDGERLAQLSQVNRTDVPLSRVPPGVQRAVLSAEDRNFYGEAGISPTGILRALWVDVRGGDIQQGGSTITQQYVKNAYLTQQRTFTRKLKEIFISLKLGQTKSKPEILQDYLNTIYFGRGAYGIQAASRAYFGVNVDHLTVAQGAVLAAAIRAPSFYDPRLNPGPAKQRWQYVVDGMVKEHWLTPEQAQQLHYPHVISPAAAQRGTSCTGDIGFICQAVREELARHGFDEERLNAGGYRIYTTIDKTAQRAAEQSMQSDGGTYQSSGADRGREAALVSVQPGNGAIRALYGGGTFCVGKRPDVCTDLTGVGSNYTRSPGSSMKPYTLITALQEGIGLDSTFDGPPHIDFPGTNGKGIYNSQNENCPHCTLTIALARSINTIFVPLAQKVGPDKIAQNAHSAGISKRHQLAEVPTITLGSSDVSALDQAVGYATIAAQGQYAAPYLVGNVRTQSGTVVYSARKDVHRVFAADVMADTTYAMTKVLDCSSQGTACGKALPGRPAAGKTGTNGEQVGNKDAWFIGFTPQLSTAVWFGNHDRNAQVTDHGNPLYGGGLPAQVWHDMMTNALAGKPVESFPPPAHVGKALNSPSPHPSTTSPSPTPSVTVTITLTPTPSTSPSQPLPTITPGSPTPSASPSANGGSPASAEPARPPDG